MVLTVRLDDEYESLFKKLKEKVTENGNLIKIAPSNTQIIKAMMLYAAKYSGINIDNYYMVK